jgi:hypothetical protein
VGWWLGVALVAVAPRAHAQSTASFPSDAPATPPPAPRPAPPPPRPATVPVPARPPPPAAQPAPPKPAPAPSSAKAAPALVPYEPPPGTASNDPRPPVLPYYEGMPVPPGYQIVHRPATGLLAGGFVGMGVSYGAALIVAATQGFDNATGWLALPIAGPWLAIAERSYEQCRTSTIQQARRCVSEAVGEVQFITFVAVDGVFQIASGLLILAGALSSKDELIRGDLVHVDVRPSPTGSLDWAVSVQGRF